MSSQSFAPAALFALLLSLGCGSNSSNTADNCAGVDMPASLPKACATCVAAHCCSAATACARNSECGPLTDCAFSCQPDDATCQQNCAGSYPTGVDSYNMVSDCALASCPDTCVPGNSALSGSGGTGKTTGGAPGIGRGGWAGTVGGSTGASGSGSTGGSSSGAIATCPIDSLTCSDCLQAQCTSDYQACQANATCKADFDTARACSCVAQKAQNAFGVQLCFDSFFTAGRSNFISCTQQVCTAQCGVP